MKDDKLVDVFLYADTASLKGWQPDDNKDVDNYWNFSVSGI